MDLDFLKIINDHKPLVYKICHLYCKEAEDKKDLFQEIVLQIWKSYPNFRQQSTLGTWIYKIALNTAITHFKKETKSIKKDELSHQLDIPDLPLSNVVEEQHQLLFNAIETLDKIEKSIILLYLEEKSYDEISEILGISKSNVGVKLMRIKTKLSNQIKDKQWN